MMQSILRQANFKGANLLGASFFDADLTSTELLATPSSMVPVLVPCHWKVCDLVFAVWLTGYVCRPTNSGADLSDADLRGADFSLANLTKVK